MAKDVTEPNTPVPPTSTPVPDEPAPQFKGDAMAPSEISLKSIKDTAKRLAGSQPTRGSK